MNKGDTMLKNGDRVHVLKTGRAAKIIEIMGAVTKVQWIVGDGISIVPTRFLEAR